MRALVDSRVVVMYFFRGGLQSKWLEKGKKGQRSFFFLATMKFSMLARVDPIAACDRRERVSGALSLSLSGSH